jgi:predicted RNA-binding Zn ribbon-like protein
MDPLVGEPLALDLVNTRAHTPAGEIDFLDSPDGLRAWLDAEAGRLTPPDRPIDLVALRSLRDHVVAAVTDARTGAEPPVDTLRALTAAQRAAPGYRELVWNGTSVAAMLRRDGDATRTLLAELAESAAELLASPGITQVRRCEGPECRMLFLPASPRRRWCSPALCGNRVRVARHYQRRKSQ